ncbi:MAG: hypothetical protein LBH26_06885 [Treponema sp.]|jgi:hypothetical protein|nr:hypothetical protein [Treponema sp.]
MNLNGLIQPRLERIKNFYAGSRGVLINVGGIGGLRTLPGRPLNSWNFPEDLRPYLDAGIGQAELHWAQRQELDDDLLPSVYPWFGIAEHSAIFGGEIKFEEVTSYHVPLIRDWGMLDSLVLSGDSKWFRMLMDGFEYLKEKTEGRFLLRLRGSYAPLDMAMVLRGMNNFLTDIYDYPDELNRLLDLSVKAIKWSFENQQKIVGQLEGGYLTGMSVWVPGNSAGHISEDASVLCSPDVYREFGRPYTARLCAAYDNMLMHLHGAGKHAFAGIVSVPGINCVELSNDPNCPGGLELLKEYGDILEGKVILLHLNRKEIEENRSFLASKKLIIDYEASSLEDAKSAVEMVRNSVS